MSRAAEASQWAKAYSGEPDVRFRENPSMLRVDLPLADEEVRLIRAWKMRHGRRSSPERACAFQME
jgi:hypothetical protein